jgi:hypothetical protein
VHPDVQDPDARVGPDTWIMEIRGYMKDNTLRDEHASVERIVRMAKRYTLVEGDLYRRGANDVLLRYIIREEGCQLLVEIHGGECDNHASSHTLVGKAFRHGFSWPTTLHDVVELAPGCSLTQSPGASTPHPSQHHRFSIFSFFRGHLTMDGHLRSFPGSAATAKMSASTSRTSSTTSLALVTNGPTPHQCCPPLDRRCRRKSYPGELPTPLAPQINSPCCPIALATTPAPPRRWASPDLAGAAAGRRGEQAPLFHPWATSPSRGWPITEAG